MAGAAAGDHWLDPSGPQHPSILVVVIATIGQQQVGLAPGASTLAGDRPRMKIFKQRQQLGDVVAVATGQRDSEWDTTRVNQQMML